MKIRSVTQQDSHKIKTQKICFTGIGSQEYIYSKTHINYNRKPREEVRKIRKTVLNLLYTP